MAVCVCNEHELKIMDEGQLRFWLDTNNQKLLSEIENQIPVKFTLWGKESYGCQVHKNKKGEKCEVEVYYKEPPTQAKKARNGGTGTCFRGTQRNGGTGTCFR